MPDPFDFLEVKLDANSGKLVVQPLPKGGQLEADAAQVKNTAVFGGPGIGVNAKKVVSGFRNNVTIVGETSEYVWGSLSTLVYNGLRSDGQHVAHYVQSIRNKLDPTGVGPEPELWATCEEYRNHTGAPSSKHGYEQIIELDLVGSNLDDASRRTATSTVLLVDTIGQPNPGFFEVESVHSTALNDGVYARRIWKPYGLYTAAALDLRFTGSFGLNQDATHAGSVTPKVVSTVTNSATVSVSNVLPFTAGSNGGVVGQNGETNKVYFGSSATSATILGYAVTGTGPAPAGTLTLSAPVSVSAGTTVYNNSRAIWLDTNNQIGLDTAGNTWLSSDGGVVSLNGALRVSGALLLAAGQIASSGSDKTATMTLSATNIAFTSANPIAMAKLKISSELESPLVTIGQFQFKTNMNGDRLEIWTKGTSAKKIASFGADGMRLLGGLTQNTTP